MQPSVSHPHWGVRHCGVRALAVLGAGFVVVQVWGYLGWVLADLTWQRTDLTVPADVRASVIRGERILVGLATVWCAYLILDVVRARRLTWPALLSLAWAGVYWQESLVNLDGRRFTYNAYFLTRGDWIPNLPFSSASAPMLDQPVLMEGLVFACLIPAVGLAAAGLVTRLRARGLPVPVVIAVVLLAAALFETGFEFAGISQQLLVWNAVPEHLSLRTGTPSQWPMTEFPLGFVWAMPGVLWALRDRWRALSWLAGTGTAVRLLALTGLINAVFLVYNLVLALVPATSIAAVAPWLQG